MCLILFVMCISKSESPPLKKKTIKTKTKTQTKQHNNNKKKPNQKQPVRKTDSEKREKAPNVW